MNQQDQDESQQASRHPFQFGVGFLLFLMTGFAISSLALRGVSNMFASPGQRWVLGTYVVLMSLYVLIRIPMIVRRTLRRQRQVVDKRRRMSNWANTLRESNAGDPSGEEK